MARSNIGKLVAISNNVLDYLKWEQHELVGHNIGTMMMPFLADIHNQTLTRHLDPLKNGSTTFHRNLETFISTKKGYILPCYVYISISPYIQKELTYTGIIRLKKHEKEEIIFDYEENIQGFTKNVAKYLHLIKSKKYSLAGICSYIKETSMLGLTDSFHPSRSIYHAKLDVEYKNRKRLLEIFKDSKEDKKEVALELSSLKQRNIGEEKASYNVNAILTRKVFEETIYYSLSFDNLDNADQKGGDATNFLIRANSAEPEDYREKESAGEGLTLGLNNENIEVNTSKDATYVLPDVPVFDTKLDHTKEGLVSVPTNLTNHTEPKFIKYEEKKSQDSPKEITVNKFVRGHSKQKLFKQQKKIISPKQKTYLKAKMDLDDARSSHYTSTLSYSARIEQALYVIPQQSKLKLLNITFVLAIILAASLLIVFQYQNSNGLKVVERYIEMTSVSTMQLFTLIEINHIARNVLNLPSLPYHRLAWLGIFDDRLLSQILLTYLSGILKRYAAIERNSLYFLEGDSKHLFFKEIDAIEWDPDTNMASTRKTTSFGLIADIVAEIEKFNNVIYTQLTPNDASACLYHQ